MQRGATGGAATARSVLFAAIACAASALVSVASVASAADGVTDLVIKPKRVVLGTISDAPPRIVGPDEVVTQPVPTPGATAAGTTAGDARTASPRAVGAVPVGEKGHSTPVPSIAPAAPVPAAPVPAAPQPAAPAPSESTAQAAAAVSIVGLTEAHRLAREFDPTFRAARFELDAGLQAVPIARAQLLPNVSASAALSRSEGEREVPALTGSSTSDLDYTSHTLTLQLRQPLYNRELGVRLRQAESQTDYARAQFAVREQELVLRLAQAYFELLFAEDVIELAQIQVRAYDEQVQLARRRFEKGEGTRTEIADAEARKALAEADLIDARGRRQVSLDALTAITGPLPAPVASLRAGWAPPPLEPAALARWLDIAREHNPQIRVQRYSVEYVMGEVQRVRSGHFPRVDLVASINDSKSDSINTVDQTIRQNQLGVQLSVPIYAGGGINAQTEQALSNLAKEESRLDAVTSEVMLEVQRQHLSTTNAWARIAAYESAVRSSEVALRGAEVGVRAGLRVQADVLDAQRLWYVSRRDLARARYQYLVARLSLQAAAGTLTDADIVAVDTFLAK